MLSFSFGGMVAQELAISHCDPIDRLVLCCTSSGGKGQLSDIIEKLANRQGHVEINLKVDVDTSAPEHQDSPVLGVVCAIAAYFFFAIMQVFANILSENHSVIEIAFYRNLIALIIFLVFIVSFWQRGRRILKINKNPRGIIIRSVLGILSLMLTFAAFAEMPMADVTALMFTSSLLIPALGVFFLAEKVVRARAIFSILRL